jgi:hypothetical protein
VRWVRIITILLVGVVTLMETATAYADSAEQDVFTLVNAQRVQHGVPPLVISPELTNAAEAYAAALANGGFFSHTAPDGSTFITRDEAAGYRGWDYLEENLAAGQTSPQQVVAAWMASPEHRANILSPNVHEIGIGHVYRAGSVYGNYWVQEFGDRPGVRPTSYSVPSASSTSGSPGSGNAPPSTTPVTAPASASNTISPSWLAPTGYVVSGQWLSFVRSHGNVDNFGLPRTGVIQDPLNNGQTDQYFQRAVLEYHPENPPGSQIQRRLLGDILYPGADPPVSQDDPPPGPWEYFPFSPDRPTGLGHFVANYTRTGQPTYFKDYFDSHGGVAAFGYPKEEPKLRDGLWTQRFQAAVFQYHPEYDQDGYVPGTTTPLRTYRVQLELLGDEYIKAMGLPFN